MHKKTPQTMSWFAESFVCFFSIETDSLIRDARVWYSHQAVLLLAGEV